MGWEWKRGIRKEKRKKKGKGEIGKGRGRGTCGMSCIYIMSSIPHYVLETIQAGWMNVLNISVYLKRQKWT